MWIIIVGVVCLIVGYSVGYGKGKRDAFREVERAHVYDLKRKIRNYRNRNKRTSPNRSKQVSRNRNTKT